MFGIGGMEHKAKATFQSIQDGRPPAEMDMNDLDLHIVDLHWDSINSERSHFGVGVGLHIADLSTQIVAVVEADIDGVPVDPPIDLGTSSAGIAAPLPNISVRGIWP